MGVRFYIILLLVFILAYCGVAQAAAKCRGCGSALVTFSPFDARERFMAAPHGAAFYFEAPMGGEGHKHICNCLYDGGTPLRCYYTMEGTGNPEDWLFVGDGACLWRHIDNNMVCFDVSCTGSGDPVVTVPATKP